MKFSLLGQMNAATKVFRKPSITQGKAVLTQDPLLPYTFTCCISNAL